MSAINDIFAQLVAQASDELSNNSCNDFLVVVSDANREALRTLCEEVAQDDDHLESLLEQLKEGKIWFQDWMVLDALVTRLQADHV